MARVSYRSADINLMARMMRAEAEGEGEGRLGMLYIGNVIVNRLAANCIDFKNLRTVSQVIYQVQGGTFRLKLFKKAMFFIKEREVLKKDLSPTVAYFFNLCFDVLLSDEIKRELPV
ncbi:hypothetical protein PMEGAS228_49010 [Priestia megaterium]